MLRFFRNIRQKLIEQEKARKYILYAIGEILLVVVGILIAVQVNLALENSENETRKEQMLIGLKTEFEQNLVQLDTVLFYYDLVLSSGNELIDLMKDPESYDKVDTIYDLLSKNGTLWTFDPNDGVLKSSISAGDIHFIDNDSLKINLFSWESRVMDAKEEQVRATIQYQEHFLPYLEGKISIGNTVQYYSDELPSSNFASDFQSLMSDRAFENLLFSRSINTLDAIIELKELYDLNATILKLIEQEVN